jgi:signal transduction histidine kinase
MESRLAIATSGQRESATVIHQPWLRILRITWILLAFLSVLILFASIPGFLILMESRTSLIEASAVSPFWIEALNYGIIAASISAGSLSLFLAWLIFRQNSNQKMQVYLMYFLLLYGVAVAGPLEAIYPFSPSLSAIDISLIIASLLGPAFVTLFVMFPDGRLVPGWTRWVILLSFSIVPVSYFLEASSFTLLNEPIFLLAATAAIGSLGLSLYAQIYRFKYVSDTSQRQQTKWVIYGIGLWFLVLAAGLVPYAQVQQLTPGTPLPWWHLLNELVYLISMSLLPLSLTIAVSRYRLFDIDIIINRTLVYGSLTITTMGIYTFIVGYIGNRIQAISQSTLAFLATGLVALIFQPLRERLQKSINRFMFGERDDPFVILSSLAERLEIASEPEDILPSIVETVGQALKIPYIAIEVNQGQSTSVITEYGIRRKEFERFPLIYQSEMVGQLVIARRSPQEQFREAEYRLLRNIARQTGAAVHAAKLAADLRRSRQQLVNAREEERRRLRRDLHDGLGPTLASLTLKIDNARNELNKDPESADRLLVETKALIQETLKDIRRLVYELRPPSLDDLGLLKAIQAFINQQNINTLHVQIAADSSQSELPAAVEVAAYRITLEAITNVIRHAQATRAIISLSHQKEDLIIEIHDNGRGLPEPLPAGVGITSMKERAEELGGHLVINSQGSGTNLRANLPCHED